MAGRQQATASETAIDELGGVSDPTPATLDSDERPRAISGRPETLAGLSDPLIERVGVGLSARCGAIRHSVAASAPVPALRATGDGKPDGLMRRARRR